MAMLDVSCEHCGKQFRVRGEFAGKSTRCPGCSKPLSIGLPVTAQAPPPRDEDDDAPRLRRRTTTPKTESVGMAPEWKGTLKALGNEQAAVRFLGVQVLADVIAFCLSRVAPTMNNLPPLLVVLFLLFCLGPAIMAVVMGLSARVAVLNIPSATTAGGTAWSSTICGLGGLLSVLLLGLAFLMSLEGNARSSQPMFVMALASGFLMTGGAVFSFTILIAQVGMTIGSREISGAIGRMGISFTVCLVATLLFGGCVSVMSGAFAPRNYNQFGPTPMFEGVVAIGGFSMLLTSIILLVFYHSLLSHAKKALANAGTPE